MTKPKAQTVINVLLVIALALVGSLNLRQERRIAELEGFQDRQEQFNGETVTVVGSILNYLRGGQRFHSRPGRRHDNAPKAITPAAR